MILIKRLFENKKVEVASTKQLNIPVVIKSVCENCRWKNNRHTEPCNQCSNNYGLLFEQTVL
jgi:hypothetical protein